MILIFESKIKYKWHIKITDIYKVLGREPIRITLSLSLWSFFSGFALEKSPDRSPTDNPEVALFPSAINSPLVSPLALPLTLLVELAGSFIPRLAPQGQCASFLKHGLWNTASQDIHFSVSPSCWLFNSVSSKQI